MRRRWLAVGLLALLAVQAQLLAQVALKCCSHSGQEMLQQQQLVQAQLLAQVALRFGPGAAATAQEMLQQLQLEQQLLLQVVLKCWHGSRQRWQLSWNAPTTT
jgi:hypothetical protein